MAANDVEIYTGCMNDLLSRMRMVRAACTREITTGVELFDTEFVYLQFRKMLEAIAFASIAANKDAYTSVRSRAIGTDWRAKKILEIVEDLNPQFYPQPLKYSHFDMVDGRKIHRLQPADDGALTKAEFVELYDYCGDILHTRNPYSGDYPVINVRLDGLTWLSRIEQLVRLHSVRLLSGVMWVGAVPDIDGRVHTYTGEPVSEAIPIPAIASR